MFFFEHRHLLMKLLALNTKAGVTRAGAVLESSLEYSFASHVIAIAEETLSAERRGYSELLLTGLDRLVAPQAAVAVKLPLSLASKVSPPPGISAATVAAALRAGGFIGDGDLTCTWWPKLRFTRRSGRYGEIPIVDSSLYPGAVLRPCADQRPDASLGASVADGTRKGPPPFFSSAEDAPLYRFACALTVDSQTFIVAHKYKNAAESIIAHAGYKSYFTAYSFREVSTELAVFPINAIFSRPHTIVPKAIIPRAEIQRSNNAIIMFSTMLNGL
jgi:hypothetical protein